MTDYRQAITWPSDLFPVEGDLIPPQDVDWSSRWDVYGVCIDNGDLVPVSTGVIAPKDVAVTSSRRAHPRLG